MSRPRASSNGSAHSSVSNSSYGRGRRANVTPREALHRDGRDARNVVRWRIANEPAQSRTSRSSNSSSHRRGGSWGSKASGESSGSAGRPRTANRVAKHPRGPRRHKPAPLHKTPTKRTPADLRAKIWKLLMQNLKSASDELYSVAEYVSEPSFVEEALAAFNNNVQAFQRLLDRLAMQAKGGKQSKRAMAWEVRTSSPGMKALDVLRKYEDYDWSQLTTPMHPTATARSSFSSSAGEPTASRTTTLTARAESERRGSFLPTHATWGSKPQSLAEAAADVIEPTKPGSPPAVAASKPSLKLDVSEGKGDDDGVGVVTPGSVVSRASPITVEDSATPSDLSVEVKRGNEEGDATPEELTSSQGLLLPSPQGLWADIMGDEDDFLSPALSPQQGQHLHKKLSSPDRRRPSPSETKRRQEERQNAAEGYRRRMHSQRQHRLRQQSNRVRTVTERNAQKKLEQERQMRERMEQAEQRHEAHVKAIARKAGSENMKVNEVGFINQIQTETKKKMIQQRLDATEARRQEHLQKKRNSATVGKDKTTGRRSPGRHTPSPRAASARRSPLSASLRRASPARMRPSPAHSRGSRGSGGARHPTLWDDRAASPSQDEDSAVNLQEPPTRRRLGAPPRISPPRMGPGAGTGTATSAEPAKEGSAAQPKGKSQREKDKTRKKKARKLRSSMANLAASDEFKAALARVDEPADEGEEGKARDAVPSEGEGARVVKLVNDLRRLMAANTLSSAVENRLRDLYRCLEGRGEDGGARGLAKLFRCSGGLEVALQCCTKEAVGFSPRIVLHAMRAIAAAIADCDSNRVYLLLSNLGVPVVDVLAAGLEQVLSCDDVDDMLQRPTVDVSMLSAALHTMWLLLRPEASCGQETTIRQSLIRYVVYSAVITKLTKLFAAVRSSPNIVKAAPLLHKSLAFLESITASPRALKKPVFEQVATNGAVTKALRETSLAGLLGLLLSLLMAVAPPSRSSSSSPELPPDTLMTMLLVVKVVNNTARLDLEVMHSIMTDAGVQMEFHHVLEYVLAYVAAKMGLARPPAGTDDMLHEAVVCMGYYALHSKGTQEQLHWGKSPTPLQRLCDLPIKYFSDKLCCDVLFPTLIAATVRCDQNLTVVRLQINTQLLARYAKDAINCAAAAASSEDAGEQGPDSESPTPVQFRVENRVPIELLNEALTVFA